MGITIATVNVNGIRAAVKHRSERNLGFHQWIDNADCDVVLLQEVRANADQTAEALAPLLDEGWHYEGAVSEAKGRAGVGILSRFPLENVQRGIPGFEESGRWIGASIKGADAGLADDDAELRIASLYLPSGAEGPKQDEKYEFFDALGPVMAQRAETYKYMLVAGDWNVCHRRQDLKNWSTNRKRAGFLPDERAFLDSLFGVPYDGVSQICDVTEAPRGVELDDGRRQGNAGAIGDYYASEAYDGRGGVRTPAANPQWVDVQRHLNPDDDGPYSWYTWRGKAFDTGAGWRIDLHAATQPLAELAQSARTDVATEYDLRWSDHSPVVVQYGAS